MVEQFLNHIERHALCHHADRIMLAVSGGVDSTVMLHLFQQTGFQIGVAHCNFQLRGKESDADEEFVRELCKQQGVPFFSIRFDTEAYAWENGLSTQMAARELRYSWFNELLEQHTYTHLATAHHFDDTMETILLNWIRGSSVEGLAGIPVKNGPVIRPLLFALRADVEKYAAEHRIAWREDQSNLTDDYQRNFVRHQILPKLRELNPSLETTLHTGLEKMQGDLELIHHHVEEWKKQFVSYSEGRITIQKKGFDSLRQQAHLLRRVIREYGFNFEQAREMIQSLHHQPGKKFFSPSHQLVVDRTTLIITPYQDFWNEVVIPGEGEAHLGPWDLSIRRSSELNPGGDKLDIILDADKVKFPLTWRKWKPGDFFYPLGMEHKRKLSDFLIDNKLSLVDKDSVTVLESEGQIIWVVGYRIDNRFKITPQTRTALALTITPYFM